MITVNLYYKGTDGNARAFAEEKESSGIAEAQEKRLACIRLYGFFAIKVIIGMNLWMYNKNFKIDYIRLGQRSK